MDESVEKILKDVYGRWKKKRGGEPLHPDDETFASFAEGRLPDDECARIKEHILSCEECSLVLAVHLSPPAGPAHELPAGLAEKCRSALNSRLASVSLSVSLREKDGILQILNTTGDVLVGQELVPAAVFRSRQIQGFKGELTILKDFRDLRAELKIEKKPGGDFSVSITALGKADQQPFADIRVSLCKDDIELESSVTGSAAIVFDRVQPGKYFLELLSTRERLAVIFLDIKV